MEREFWIEKLAERVNKKFPNEDIIHLSCGLSIRGPQHIGRIRGELCIPNGVKITLEKRYGKRCIHYIVLYSMDPIKRKALEKIFDEELVKKYDGVSLFKISDPFDCHKNWEEHFWQDFGNYLEDFGFEVKIVRTDDFYKMEETKELIKWLLRNRERVIEIVNKFRKRNPWPKDYIPINPICNNCFSINHTIAKSYDLEKWEVEYFCSKCKNSGKTSLENSKLNWRLEWPLLWKVLHIEFEPYGKDHAVSGGSRDTCSYFSKALFNFEAPIGEWNEWVSLKMGGRYLGEMTASGFIGITPKEWLEVCEPEILRFLYFSTRPHTSITIDIDNLNIYYDKFDRAERIYFGLEKEENERERMNIIKSFELSLLRKRNKPFPQVPFLFATLVAQVSRIDKGNFEKAFLILKRTKHLNGKESEEEIEYVKRRLIKAFNWVKKYAKDKIIKINESLDKKILDKISENQIKALKFFSKRLKKDMKEEEIVENINLAIEKFNLKKEEFFEAIYLILISDRKGPRLINLIKVIGEDKVKELLEKI